MRAVILDADRGNRMGRFGNEHPKCLYEFVGRASLDRQLVALTAGCASELGIVRGYRAELSARPELVYLPCPCESCIAAMPALCPIEPEPRFLPTRQGGPGTEHLAPSAR